jgi:hypothetical protein
MQKPYGSPGHLHLVIIAKLAALLDGREQPTPASSGLNAAHEAVVRNWLEVNSKGQVKLLGLQFARKGLEIHYQKIHKKVAQPSEVAYVEGVNLDNFFEKFLLS